MAPGQLVVVSDLLEPYILQPFQGPVYTALVTFGHVIHSIFTVERPYSHAIFPRRRHLHFHSLHI